MIHLVQVDFIIKYHPNANMDLSSEEERLYNIFYDLQKDRIREGKHISLIDKKRELVPKSTITNFQADSIKKQIHYNPEYVRNSISKFNDNVIRFILLHEEGHITIGKSKTMLLMIIFSIAILAGFAFLWLTNYLILGLVFLFVSLSIGFSAIWRYCWDEMYEDEFISDNYASEILVNFFNDWSPSKALKSFLDDPRSEKEITNTKKLKILRKIIGFYPDYHPSDCSRIEKIEQRFRVN